MQSALRACDKIETSIVAIVSTNASTRTFLKIGFLCCYGSHVCLAGLVRHSDASVDMRGHMRQMSRAIPAETLVEDLAPKNSFIKSTDHVKVLVCGLSTISSMLLSMAASMILASKSLMTDLVNNPVDDYINDLVDHLENHLELQVIGQ